MSPIAANLQAVRERIRAAASATPYAGAHDVELVAVSKTQPPAAIRDAYAAGQRAFGENYVQEALAKLPEVADLAIDWHFIGPIQSNKTKSIAAHFAWAHGVDRLKIAEALSRHRDPAGLPLNICLQVNVSGEASKSGVAPAEAPALAAQIAGLANLRLRGLMTIIENVAGEAEQRAQFALLREVSATIVASGVALDTLSMGMTQDFEAAIAEGATIVRIGTAIFGPRARGNQGTNDT